MRTSHMHRFLYFLIFKGVLWGCFASLSPLFAQQIRAWEIAFEPNSARLTQAARAMLDTLPVSNARTLSLYGHTDAQTEGDNASLSALRMDAVADLLAKKQPQAPIPARHIMGKMAPAMLPAQSVVHNRRVLVVAGFSRENPPPVRMVVEGAFLPIQQQWFVIPSDRPQVIRGSKGTVLEIPAGAFRVNGKPATGPVEIRLTEVYTFDDMLRNALTTVTDDGQLLETGGMFRLEVTVDGQPVDSVLNQPITVSFGEKKQPGGMSVFHGGDHPQIQGITVWNQRETVYAEIRAHSDNAYATAFWTPERTTLPFPVNPYLSFYDLRSPAQQREDARLGRDSSYYHPDSAHFKDIFERLRYGQENESLEVICRELNTPAWKSQFRAVMAPPAYQRKVDSCLRGLQLFQSGGYSIAHSTTTQGQSYVATITLNDNPLLENTLTIDRIGWINCDRFLNLPPNTLRTVTATVPAGFRADSSMAVLYLKRYKSALPGYFAGGSYTFPNLPVNTEATLVLVKKDGKAFEAAMKPLIITGQTVSIAPGSHSIEQVLAYLKTY